MILKTLKNIGLETCILKRELREEAIKIYMNWQGTFEEFMEWFFDITEEDLK